MNLVTAWRSTKSKAGTAEAPKMNLSLEGTNNWLRFCENPVCWYQHIYIWIVQLCRQLWGPLYIFRQIQGPHSWKMTAMGTASHKGSQVNGFHIIFYKRTLIENARDWTWDLQHTKHMLYHWATALSLCTFVNFISFANYLLTLLVGSPSAKPCHSNWTKKWFNRDILHAYKCIDPYCLFRLAVAFQGLS